jgi:hypothetical protein
MLVLGLTFFLFEPGPAQQWRLFEDGASVQRRHC